jgi:hypothetical protein
MHNKGTLMSYNVFFCGFKKKKRKQKRENGSKWVKRRRSGAGVAPARSGQRTGRDNTGQGAPPQNGMDA